MSLKLVLCPLRFELDYIIDYFHRLNFRSDPIKINYYVAYIFPELNVIIAEGGRGKVQFAITTQKIVSKFSEICSIICAGSAGGLSTSLAIGDVVVATETLEHDFKNRYNPKAARPLIAGDELMLTSLRSFSSPHFKVHFDRMASGDEDIVDLARVAELYADTSAVAVAWEGIGAAKVGRFNKIPFLEIRGITDNARNEVVSNFRKNLPNAMENVAQVLQHLIAVDFT